MKKVIKKIIIALLIIIASVSFILMFGENPDGSVSLSWTFGWMAALVISTKILDMMGVFKEEEMKTK